jgi:ankyrin repeat protein
MKKMIFGAVMVLAIGMGVIQVEAGCDYSLPRKHNLSKREKRDLSILLSNAAVKGRVREVEQLALQGAEVDYIIDGGNTALMYAAERGYIETINILIALGADVDHANKCGNTALIWAARASQYETARILLLNGANVNHKNNDGQDALYWAGRSLRSNNNREATVNVIKQGIAGELKCPHHEKIKSAAKVAS